MPANNSQSCCMYWSYIHVTCDVAFITVLHESLPFCVYNVPLGDLLANFCTQNVIGPFFSFCISLYMQYLILGWFLFLLCFSGKVGRMLPGHNFIQHKFCFQNPSETLGCAPQGGRGGMTELCRKVTRGCTLLCNFNFSGVNGKGGERRGSSIENETKFVPPNWVVEKVNSSPSCPPFSSLQEFWSTP